MYLESVFISPIVTNVYGEYFLEVQKSEVLKQVEHGVPLVPKSRWTNLVDLAIGKQVIVETAQTCSI